MFEENYIGVYFEGRYGLVFDKCTTSWISKSLVHRFPSGKNMKYH